MRPPSTPLCDSINLFQKTRSHRGISIVAAVASVLATHAAQAAILYWDGSGNNATGTGAIGWGDATSWTTDGAATSPTADVGALVPGSADIATFRAPSATGVQVINLGDNRSALGLATSSANAFTGVSTTIQGSSISGTTFTLSLGSGGISHLNGALTVGSASASVGKLEISLQDSQTWNSSPIGTAGAVGLTINANVIGTGTVANPQVLTLTGTTQGGAGNGGISGNISDGIGGGSLSIVKTGTGGWFLSGSNTFTGGVSLSVGVLNIGSSTALGTGALVISDGTTLNNSAGVVVVNTNNNAQTWNGNFAFSGTNSLNLGTGAVSLGSAAGAGRTITVGANNLTVGGSISNGATAFSLGKAGPGILTLTGSNSFTGALNVAAGTLAVNQVASFGDLGNTVTFASGTQLGIASGSALTSYSQISGAKTLVLGASFGLDIATPTFDLDTALGITNFTKTNSGTLTISASQTYSGTTSITGGVLNPTGAGTLGAGVATVNALATLRYASGSNLGSASALALNGGTILYVGSGETISKPITFTSGTTGGILDASGSGSVVYSTISNPGLVTSNQLKTVTLTGTGVGEVSGVLANATNGSAGSVALSVIKSGSGTWTLSGTNTYTGNTSTNGGLLIVTSGSNLGTGAAGVSTGAVLRYSAGSSLAGNTVINLNAGTLQYVGAGETVARSLNLAAAFAGGTLDASGTGSVLYGAVTNTGAGPLKTLTLTGTGLGEISGALANATSGTTGSTALSITKSGSGSWTLSGTSTYTGATTVSAGTLNLTGTLGGTAITVSGGSFVESAGGSIAAGGSLATVSGVATLNGSNNFTGTTTLAAGGTLNFNNNFAFNSATAAASTAKLVMGDAVTIDNASAAPVTINLSSVGVGDNKIGDFTFTGTNDLTLVGDFGFNATKNETITLGGLNKVLTLGTRLSGPNNNGQTLTVNSTGGSRLVLGSLAISSGTMQRGISLAGNANIEITNGVANSAIAGGAVNSLTMVGSGTLSLGGTSTYTGNTNINSGTVNVVGILDPTTGTTIALSGGRLNLNNANAVTKKAITITAGGVLGQNVANAISGSASLVLNSSSAVQVLSLGNNYTGVTTITDGRLQAGAANVLSAGSSVGLSSNLTAVLDLNGLNQTIGSLSSTGTSATGGRVLLGSATLTLGGDNTSTTYGNVITGTGGIVKSGSGTFTLSNTNTFTGGVLVNTGTLKLTATQTVDKINAIAIASGSTLETSSTNTFAGFDNVSGAGGTVTVSGTSLKTQTLSGSGSHSFAGALTSTNLALVVAMTSGATQTLTGTNTYTGSTFVNLGTLALGSGGSLGGTVVTVGNANITANVSGNATLNVRGNSSIGTSALGSLTLIGGNGTSVGQGTLSLLDTTINALTLANTTTGASTLTLGGTAGLSSVINLDANGTAVDTITLGATAGTGTQKMTLNAGGAVINLNSLGGAVLAPNTYNLINFAASGAAYAGSFSLGNAPQASGSVTVYKLTPLTASSTALQLVVNSANIGATAYWTGAVDSVWNTVGVSNDTNFTLNPDGSGGNVLPGDVTDVFFTANSAAVTTGRNTTTLGQDFSIKSLTFRGANSNAGSAVYTIGGPNTLTIGAGTNAGTGGGGIFVDAASANHIISAAVTLGGTQTWTLNGTNAQSFTVSGNLNAAASDLTVNGDRKLTLSGGGTLNNLILGSTQAITFGQAVSSMVVAGAITGGVTGATLTKTGTGTLTLSASNSYTGSTVVSAGSIILGNSSALSTGPVALTSASSRLVANGGISLQNAVTISGAADYGAPSIDSIGTNTFSALTNTNTGISRLQTTGGLLTIGTVGNAISTSSSQLVLQGNGNGEIVGNLVGVGGASVTRSTTGTGTWILSGSNTYTGSTNVSNGTLSLGNGGTTGSLNTASLITVGTTANMTTYTATFAVNRSNSVVQGVDFGNTIATGAVPGVGNLLQAGSGTTTLSGSNTYNGSTTVAAGALVAGANVAATGSGPFGNSTSAIVLGTATTTANNSNAALLTGGAITIARPVTIANQATTGTYRIGGNTDNSSTFSGAITASQGFSVTQVATTGANQLNLTGGISANTAGLKTVNFANIGAVNVSGTGLSNGTGTVGLTQSGSGTTTLAVASSFTGATNVTSGVLRATVAGALGGTTGTLAVTNDGSLLLSGVGAINRINDAAALAVGSGTGTSTFGFEGGVSSSTETQTASLTLNSNSIIDFGALAGVSNTGNTLLFDSLVLGGGATNIKIYNWNGTVGQSTGNLPGSDSLNRLLFASDPSTQLGMVFGNISFYSDSGLTMIGVGQEVAFGGGGGANFELIAAIPEPSTVYSLLLVAGLAGFRERRRLRSVFARNK